MDRNEVKEAIRSAVNIADVASRYTTLQPSGSKMKGLSPFTNEKTPSFFVDPVSNVYYCFSSQQGGDLFKFVQEMEGVDFKDALKILADMAGITLTQTASSTNNYAAMSGVLEHVTAIYQKHLTDEIIEFMLGRGLTRDSIRRWHIGYAPDSFNTICSRTMERKDTYIQSGMCVNHDKGPYDRFRDRIMFPFHDTQGKIIGFSGRAYGPTEMGKYINSPDSPLFNKSTFLYGLYFAKQHIRKTNAVMLTEGQIDTILAHQSGFPIAVASSGTAVNAKHLQRLFPLAKKLLIAFDSDAAGIKATLKVVPIALSMGFDVRILSLPEGQDPADVIKENPDTFRELVTNARTIIQFGIEQIEKVHGTESEQKIQGIRNILLPIISQCPDALVQAHMIQETAQYAGVDVKVIEASLTKSQDIQRDRQIMRSVKQNPEQFSQKEKLEIYKENILLALAYLQAHAIAIPAEAQVQLETVGQHLGELSETHTAVAQLQYEENFSEEERTEKALASLRDSLRFLCFEVQKKNELEKIKQIQE